MISDDQIRADWKAQGLRIKRNNLLAAFLSGSVLVYISIHLSPQSFIGTAAGFALGFFYANGFEYCLHRFLLHSGQGIFSQQHMVHHTTLNSPEAPRYVNFSRNPLGVVALFFANAAPFLVLQWVFHSRWTVGVFASFAIYYIAFEEIHWRSHMGGWLPKWLRPAARHHLLHHARDTGRFNVFLPIFDSLVESFKPQAQPSSGEAK
jgi:hypothetical protein